MEKIERLPDAAGGKISFAPLRRNHAIFILLLVCSFGGRLLVQSNPTEMEPVVGVTLLLVFTGLCFLDVKATLFSILLLPAFFGQGEIVRTYVQVFDSKLYVCDLAIFLGFLVAIAGGALGGQKEVRSFLRKHIVYMIFLGVGLLLKLVESGINADSLRNLVMFTYSVVVPIVVCLVAANTNAENDFIQCLLIGLLLCSPCIAVLDAFMLIGQKADVLKPIHQGMLQPVGVLDLLPRGTLILIGSLAAAALPDKSIKPVWKIMLIGYLVFDFATYFNRAMWFGLLFGVVMGWLIRQRLSIAITSVLVLGVGMFGASEILRTSLREGHGESSEWRLLAWNLTLGRIFEQPITGHNLSVYLLEEVTEGEEGVQEQAGITIGTHARYAHNSYLSLLFYGGILLGGAVIWFITSLYLRMALHIRKLWKQGKADPRGLFLFRCFSSALLYAGLNVVLETPIEGITFWVILSLCWLYMNRLKPEQLPTQVEAIASTPV